VDPDEPAEPEEAAEPDDPDEPDDEVAAAEPPVVVPRLLEPLLRLSVR
jgi:hypothetical protein